jgi:hypothetical protein
MMNFVRSTRLAAVAACALALFAMGAHAETMDNTQWGFSAVFPCQSQLSSQPVATNAGNVTLTMYMCSEGETAYFVGVTDYPAGAIAQRNLDDVYNGVANGAATNSNGTIRSLDPYTLGNVAGRDAVIDVASSKQTMHARFFIVGDRLYQELFLGPSGEENSKASLDFLNAFALK